MPIFETSVGFVCNFSLIHPGSFTCDETKAIHVNTRACNALILMLCSFYHVLCRVQYIRLLCVHKSSVLARRIEYIRSHVGLLFSQSLPYSTRRLFVSRQASSEFESKMALVSSKCALPLIYACTSCTGYGRFMLILRISEIHSADCS